MFKIKGKRIMEGIIEQVVQADCPGEHDTNAPELEIETALEYTSGAYRGCRGISCVECWRLWLKKEGVEI